MAPITVRGFDHLVLVVDDVERSLAWYTERLGLEGVRVEQWRAGEVPFPSVRIDATTIVDLLARRPGTPKPQRGVLDHLCLVVDRADVDTVVADERFEVVDGPGWRFGAQGAGWSVYVRDPDGITVELRAY